MIGKLFEKLGNINAEKLEGYTITKINEEINKNYLKLMKDTKEIGVMMAEDESFTFYWEQTAGNAQEKVDAITT